MKKMYKELLICFIVALAITFCFSCAGATDYSYLKQLPPPAFDSINSPVEGSDNQFLVLGKTPPTEIADNVSEDLAALAGRWEGYNLNGAVARDYKLVLTIKEITKEYITFEYLSTNNLQVPLNYFKGRANIIMREPYTFEVTSFFVPEFNKALYFRIVYDKESDSIEVEQGLADGEPIVPGYVTKLFYSFERNSEFVAYRDYQKYLAELSISVNEYETQNLADYGKGYMLYLPENYQEKDNWPLIVFLHGGGDIGNEIEVLAKASPYMFIRSGGKLPFVIASPLLGFNNLSHSFPLEYMKSFLEYIKETYKIDDSRIYFSGLSTGGEAALRFSIFHPEDVAAAGALCPPLNIDGKDDLFINQGWEQISSEALAATKEIPFLIISGSEDLLVPSEKTAVIAEMFEKAGAYVDYRLLEGRDHNVWDDTYSDPAFYEWLLSHTKGD